MSEYRKKLLAIFIAFSFVLSMVSVFAFNVYQAEIDENISLEEGGIHRVLVKVSWNPDLDPIKFNHDAVIAELKAEAAATQDPILGYLRQKADAEVLNTFWLTNLILVEAETTTIREMATFTGVDKILDDFEVTLLAIETDSAGDFEVAETAAETASAEATWNIEKVRAPEVWEELEITGQGVRFATSDTGIHLGHPDLADTLYTDDPTDPTYPGGWIEFDSDGNIVPGSMPHDTHGHGTATYGLMVGDAAGPYGAVGMAPGAAGLGMHALNLPYGEGTAAQTIAGLQWIIDPFDQYGNPAGEWARVSSHSWGWVDGYQDIYIEPINNMYYAGHFVVAGMGNEYEGSCRSPADVYRCVGAGATDINDYVPSWSSGAVYDWPASWPEPYIQPDISAPGDFPIIPFPPDTYTDDWYGTSFASPQIGGAAVLMLSGNPSLNPDEVKEALQETAVWYDYYYPEPPDTRYGCGRIDAYEAVKMVALPQGINGTVTDAVSGDPLSQVEVYALEADRSVYTDESGYYDMRLLPGTYNLTFSRFGYYQQTVYDVVVEADVFTWLDKELTPVPPGYVEGHVYFLPTIVGIPGATVEVLDIPVTIEAETDAEGYYSLAIPPGTYDLEASTPHFSSDLEEGVTVSEGLTTTVDFYLEQPAKVAVIDYYGYASPLIDFLTDEGYTVHVYSNIPAILPFVTEYGCIIANNFGYSVYSSDLMDFIDLTDANGIGVLWLDSWSSYCGAYWLRYHLGWPPGRYTYYASTIEHLYYKVTQTDNDIIPGYAVGDKIIFDESSYYKDHAYYRYVEDGDIPGIGTVKTLADAGYHRYGYDTDEGQGLIKVTRADNKWVLLSMHANTAYTNTGNWHDDSKEVFLNSINWVAKPQVGIPKFVVFDLDVEPEVTMWKYPVDISVGIKNVGWITGTDTVEMYIDTVPEGSEDVTLAPAEYSYLSWVASRFDVGTYTVRVRHLTTKFKVRPPIIELQAYEFCTDQPLAGADVYGYYRKYAGPGWFEQWSHTYGGDGHSQHAQPIGDIDEDGVNEIIVGGYETTGTARILSFDAATGTYIEEYSWYVPGGTYHSPSGSTILDLDEDGDLEFVISWTYSGADGIYAYDWDGETLTELDYYAGGFVFDVYSCDYDDDGYVEVLIANHPGMTPYTPVHVMAFAWDKTEGKFVVETSWRKSGTGYYWEMPMIWSGDVDGDGKTEVIGCISDSYYNTAGTWALHWNPTLGKWEEELVYDKLINTGTHYGVAVGDIDGDGIPEIGIGNDYSDYSIMAGAVLMEWDGSTYQKVWEGKWPTESPVIEALAIGDADNDGQNEFCVGGGNVHVIAWTGTEYAEEATITETEGMLSGVVIGDCDTDGLNEVKATNIIYGPGKEHIFKYTEEPTPIPGWDFMYFGNTDENGMLAFDSPASVVDVHLFVYKPEMTTLGYQYLLQKDLHIDNDIAINYEPHPETEAVVISELEEASLADFPHLALTWVWKLEVPYMWPFLSWYKAPTNIVVSPAWYSFMHELYEVDPWGTWRYEMMNPYNDIRYLPPDVTYQYDFVGPISGDIEHTDNNDGTVTVTWDVTDSRGHEITGVSLDEAGLFAGSTSIYMSYVPVDVEEYEALLASIIDYKPLITLCDENDNVIKSVYVEWFEKTITTYGSTVAYATLRFVAGPYGDPAPEEIIWWIKEGYNGKPPKR